MIGSGGIVRMKDTKARKTLLAQEYTKGEPARYITLQNLGTNNAHHTTYSR